MDEYVDSLNPIYRMVWRFSILCTYGGFSWFTFLARGFILNYDILALEAISRNNRALGYVGRRKNIPMMYTQ
jgi:hypothetical protein